MTSLFEPLHLKDVRLRNRIAVSPMCQYVAEDGFVTDWHRTHYAGLGRGGAGLVVVEASAVSPEGRITPGCLGLWTDAQAEALRPVLAAIKAGGATPGLQLAHAGRKSAANRPWEGDDHMAENDPRAWPIVGPSAIPWGGHLGRTPKEMTVADIDAVRRDFVAAAKRALDIECEWLELHFAHGYLAQSFFSVHANHRADAYGGSAQNRNRFLLEVLCDVRAIWPERLPLTVRLGVIDFDGRDEIMLGEAAALAQAMKRQGLDLLDVSMGFNTPKAVIPWAPTLLAATAARMGRETGLPTATSFNITTAAQADDMIRRGDIDLAMIGRAMLANPHWPYEAANALGLAAAASMLPTPYAYWLDRYGRSSRSRPVEAA